MKRVPRAVVWQEGMLMTPEHLQAQDMFHVQHTLELARLISGNDAYGVAQLEFDDDQLADGAIVLTDVHALFASGEPYLSSMSLGDAPLTLVLPMLERDAQTTATQRIFLTLKPGSRAHEAHVDSSAQIPDDALSASNDVGVVLARTEAVLATEGTLGPSSEALEIARLTRSPEGVWQRDFMFVPRCLRLSAALPVVHRLEGLVRRLQQQRASERQGYEDAAAGPLAHWQQLARRQALDAALVCLVDLVADPSLAPRSAFERLRQAVAALLPWVADDMAAPLVGGSHFVASDLLGTFAPLCGVVEAFVASAPQMPLLRRSFVAATEGNTLRVALRSAEAESFTQFVLAVQVLATPTEEIALHIAAVWPRLAKLAAPSELSFAVAAALSAVPLRHMPHLADGLPRRDDVVYLTVDTSHPSWSAGLREGAMALEPPRLKGVTQDVHVELIGLRGSTGLSAA